MAAAGAVPCPAGRLAVPAVLTRLLASALLIAATCALLAAAAVSTMLLAAVIVAALPLATSTCLGAVPFSATLTATLTATLAATLAITLAGLLLAPALPLLGCSLAAAAVCTPAVPVSGRECKLLRRPSGSTRITSHTSRSLIGTDMLVMPSVGRAGCKHGSIIPHRATCLQHFLADVAHGAVPAVPVLRSVHRVVDVHLVGVGLRSEKQWQCSSFESPRPDWGK